LAQVFKHTCTRITKTLVTAFAYRRPNEAKHHQISVASGKMNTAIVAVLLLLTPAVARLDENGTVRAVAMMQFPKTCGMKSSVKVLPEKAALLQTGGAKKNIPGAGITEFEPFKVVLKDGFMPIDCVKDYMYYRGDKFGDNKHDYKLADTSNVSIVHYEAFVAKEDQVEMTQKVCFEFCRTVPNMGFFGIVNGRGCYCTPFYKPMESSSEECDSVCEGDTTLMCGGKSKSSVFSMHMCASTKSDLKDLHSEARTLKSSIGSKMYEAGNAARRMQSTAAALQKTFGAVGDSAATGLMQDAKVFAGEIEAEAKAAKKVYQEIGDLLYEGSGFKDYTSPETVTAAERNMEATEEAIAAGIEAEEKLEKLIELATEGDGYGPKAASQYYPIMYFVDKEFDGVPSTCGGDTTEKPIVGSNKDECAAACDNAIHSCVGYQYFSASGGLCFLFSKFDTAFYYTGCNKGSSRRFLQMSSTPANATKLLAHETNGPISGRMFEAMCYGKLSKFEGTTLKVDKSGKTDFGMKEITKADRCYA